MKGKKPAHIGFDAAAASAAKGAGVSLERGRAIIAASAHKASPAAIKANPRLKRVAGVGKVGGAPIGVKKVKKGK